ncbi:MAG TPA: 50S ribosomal protein L23 [Dehalococcoidia bacterium]|nr:50S ribosomal protein L23 [Dehalococcoidia bacterium]
MHLTEVIKKPLITEKSTDLQSRQDYVFKVAPRATKDQIRQAVEKVFKVKVIRVNVMNVPGKVRAIGRRRVLTSGYKKAIVTLAPGEKIVFFEGV